MTRDVTIQIPETLASAAEQEGLLNSGMIESLLRNELRRRQVEQLFGAADRLAKLDSVPLTPREIEAEIQSARAERRAANARGA
jgi:hypothetical protein